jgi:DtxR family Mn-dependent transcriptional regulator
MVTKQHQHQHQHRHRGAAYIQLTPNAEDYLEHLYSRDVEGWDEAVPAPDDRVLGELVRHGLATLDGSSLALTPEGQEQARGAVRRHRLAERLVHDVMNVHGHQVDEAACEFEHSLHRGIDEHICTLLGHPKTCPHGRPIPPGRCCSAGKGVSEPVIVPLAEMRPGERGAIAYLSTTRQETMQKLMALGALPGAPVSVIQTFPSIVFQVGQTQIALDKPLAQDIYVRRIHD